MLKMLRTKGMIVVVWIVQAKLINKVNSLIIREELAY